MSSLFTDRGFVVGLGADMAQPRGWFGVFAATLVMLLAGCASYAWVNPDATAEMTARDDAACRAEARNLAATGYVYGAVGVPWSYPPWQAAPYADPSWRAVAEQRVYDQCMRGRGYELVRPDKKG